jgi:hypothetical protein
VTFDCIECCLKGNFAKERFFYNSRKTNIIGHKTQNEDEQNKNYNRKTKKDE